MKPFAPFCNVIIANAPFDSSLKNAPFDTGRWRARLKANAPGGPVPASLLVWVLNLRVSLPRKSNGRQRFWSRCRRSQLRSAVVEVAVCWARIKTG